MYCRMSLTRWSTPSTTNAEGDTVAIHWTGTETHHGSLGGIGPTSTDVEVRSLGLSRVEDGLIAESWDSYDAPRADHGGRYRAP